MFDAARLRLTGWYLLILTIIVGLLSVVVYLLLLHVQQTELHAVGGNSRHGFSRLFAHEEVMLAYYIVAVDLVILLLAALGAYILAGRALRPIAEAMERQRRFAAAASHELRTPLTALQGNLEVALLNRRSTEEYEDTLKEAVGDIEHMGQLVKDLTVLARAESDTQLLSLAPLDLGDVARSAVETVQPLARRKQQTLTCRLPHALPVKGDAMKLRQALMNLLENAVSYTPTGGAIHVTGRRAHNHATIEVRDTGPGIQAEHLPHLFEPFYQVDTARTSVGHVGLGLSLAAWIVRAHGGQIRVESEPGVGTVFTVSLPLLP